MTHESFAFLKGQFILYDSWEPGRQANEQNSVIPGRLEESVEVLLRTADLAAVHVHEEELHVLEVDVLEDDDGVLAGVAQEEVPEVGRAHRQDQLVRGEVVVAAREGHVDELLLVAQVLRLQGQGRLREYSWNRKGFLVRLVRGVLSAILIHIG